MYLVAELMNGCCPKRSQPPNPRPLTPSTPQNPQPLGFRPRAQPPARRQPPCAQPPDRSPPRAAAPPHSPPRAAACMHAAPHAHSPTRSPRAHPRTARRAARALRVGAPVSRGPAPNSFSCNDKLERVIVSTPRHLHPEFPVRGCLKVFCNSAIILEGFRAPAP